MANRGLSFYDLQGTFFAGFLFVCRACVPVRTRLRAYARTRYTRTRACALRLRLRMKYIYLYISFLLFVG